MTAHAASLDMFPAAPPPRATIPPPAPPPPAAGGLKGPAPAHAHAGAGPNGLAWAVGFRPGVDYLAVPCRLTLEWTTYDTLCEAHQRARRETVEQQPGPWPAWIVCADHQREERSAAA